MPKSIPLYFHDGLYYRRSPIKTLKNLIRFRTLHQRVYNAGDQLSPMIVSHLAGRPAKYAAPFRKNKLIGCGSGLAAAKPNDTVWGAGFGRADHIQYLKRPKGLRILAVRGPETHRVLVSNGYECPEIYGDPGLLAPLVFPQTRSKQFRLGVIPEHPRIAEFRARNYPPDVLFIPPSLMVDEFIAQICTCSLIVTSSLQALILADAYGVPAVPMVHNGSSELAFDFIDYIESTQRSPIFIEDTAPFNIDRIESEAVRFGSPKIDTEPLIKAFPYLRADFERTRQQQVAPG